jgi:hypothetical protein
LKNKQKNSEKDSKNLKNMNVSSLRIIRILMLLGKGYKTAVPKWIFYEIVTNHHPKGYI